MALTGHVTPEMTLRYANLASPTNRDAYRSAINKMHIDPLTPARHPRRVLRARPGAVAALGSAQDQTRARLLHPRPGSRSPCPYANICERCDNFVPDPAADAVITAQLADIHTPQDDAETRGWDDEAARHARVAADLERHLIQLSHPQNACPGLGSDRLCPAP